MTLNTILRFSRATSPEEMVTAQWHVGRPRRKPGSLFADRGYDHDIYRHQVRERGIVPAIARRGTRHGTGLATYRWVIERTFAWLHGFRRLRIRWERRADIHQAFLKLACCLITHRQLTALSQSLGQFRFSTPLSPAATAVVSTQPAPESSHEQYRALPVGSHAFCCPRSTIGTRTSRV